MENRGSIQKKTAFVISLMAKTFTVEYNPNDMVAESGEQ